MDNQVSEFSNVTTISNDLYLENVEALNREVLSAAIFLTGLLGPIALFGNVLVIIVYRLRFKESATRTIVVTVALYDLLTTVVAIPGEIYSMLDNLTFSSEILCKLYVLTEQFTSTASATTLVIFALHRYRKICHPLESQMRHEMVRRLHFCTIVLAFGVTWPTLILYGNKTVVTPYGVNGTTCGIQDYFKDSRLVTVYRLSLLLMFSVGAMTLMILYIFVARKILLLKRCKCSYVLPYQKVMREMMTTVKVRSASQYSNNSTWRSARVSAASLRNSTSRTQTWFKPKRTTLMIAVTTVFIFISFLPNLILRVFEEFSPAYFSNVQRGMLICYHVLIRLFYMHCAINPIVYSIYSRKFREELKKVLPYRNTKSSSHRMFSLRKGRWIIE